MGSAAYHLCKVADGTALAAIEATPKVWDLAAAHLIVEEAGGMIQSVAGSPIFPLPAAPRDYGGVAWPTVAAAGPSIMEHLRSTLRPR
jgi:myo-inositol-1(or 4)-monophosphatase